MQSSRVLKMEFAKDIIPGPSVYKCRSMEFVIVRPDVCFAGFVRACVQREAKIHERGHKGGEADG